MNLSQSLGLQDVEANVNHLPPGRYSGIVKDSKYVRTGPDKSKVAHVLTYQVVDGDQKGKQPAEFFGLGDQVVADDQGNITSYNPTMLDSQKPWYKKRQMDLGIPEDRISTYDVAELIGKPVTFGIKHNDGYVNVSFVELRDDSAQAAAGVTGGADMGGLL